VGAIVADQPSDARRADHAGGNGRNRAIVAPPSAAADEQTLVDAQQTLGDSDQTLSDADQTGADSDQTSADDDQLAADRDQAASDRDLAGGMDPRAHALSHDVRERTARRRTATARQRDEVAQSRLLAADRRDTIADLRDAAARTRDGAAEARSLAMAQLDAASEHDDEEPVDGAAAIVRAKGRRERAAQHRARAAELRAQAAEDREAAAADRREAARGRLHALSDRRDLLAELQLEQQLRDQALLHQHRAEKLAHALQQSLSPPWLPDVPGLEVAVHYEPFAPEEVGGDFYDLFPVAPDRFGFFLGDVCGKGPAAASLTSLARYTMRTAAMLRESPEAVLRDLNAALLMDAGDDAMQTCTVAYGDLDLRLRPAVITLAVAGHPAPLIVRADGTVTPTAARGTLLGAVSNPVFETCQVSLGSDDAILVYSDGILDAEIDGIRIDEDKIAGILAGEPRAGAQTLVDRLLAALGRADGPLRDDVALMVLRQLPAIQA
jgi:serine phosphatase RsbU (regulator of sigma subunit)